jgi:hypothetical protein
MCSPAVVVPRSGTMSATDRTHRFHGTHVMSRFAALGAALVTAFVTALALVPRAAHGQLPIPSVNLMAGVSHYDLATSGSAPIGAIRVDVPLVTLVGEGSLAAFWPNEAGAHRTYIIPEAQLQYQFLPLLVRPYIGAGVGWFRAVTGPSPLTNDVTLSASAGVRIGIPLTGIGFRAEVRTREIGSSLSRRTTEYTVGVHW